MRRLQFLLSLSLAVTLTAFATSHLTAQEPQLRPVTVGSPMPDHAISSGLGLFTTDWSGSDAEQNVPTILIIDEDGTLQFKYMSQNTVDRPPLEYLVWFLEVLSGNSP